MRKNKLVILAAGTALLATCACFPFTGQAAASVEEKPLAGITLSIDRYCESVLENLKEDAEQAKKEASRDEASDDTVILSNVSEKEKQEKKEREERIELNLKYDKLGIANVDTYLNVRKRGSESAKIIGKMTKNTGCNIISVKNGWAKIESGKVKGYVKEEYLLQGEEAEKKALKVATLKAIVDTETLNVRYLPSIDSPIYDQISEDEYYTVEKEHLTKEFMQTYMAKHCSKKTVNSVEKESMYADLENWAMLSIDNEKVFISKDFVDLQYKLNRAVTIQEEQKKSSSSSSNRAAGIVSYAMQFLGNPYVWGGTSLTNGTDCSGFTK